MLNPAVVRGPAGQLYLLPRLVATGNYSRSGLSRVVVDRFSKLLVFSQPLLSSL